GSTSSTSLPTTANAYQTSLSRRSTDAFLAVLNPSLAPSAQPVYVTYLGGSGVANGNGIAVDGAGNAYLSGYADSSFPTTTGSFQTTNAGGLDAFVAKINPALSGSSSLIYSTYLGGSAQDQGWGIAVDSAANAYVTGVTYFVKLMKHPFPVTADAFPSS